MGHTEVVRGVLVFGGGGGTGVGPVTDSCENSYENSGYVNLTEFLDYLSDYWLPNTDSVLCN
jgi:hypothetical protein